MNLDFQVSFKFRKHLSVKRIICHKLHQSLNWLIGIMSRVIANGLEDLGSIPGRVIPKTLKMVLDTSLLNTQQYKVHIKGNVEEFPTPQCSSY